MKELHKIQQDNIEVTAVKPVKKELKLLGSLKPQKGHTCFQLDLTSGVITIAEFETVQAHYSKVVKGAMAVRKKLIVKENCIYTTALNSKNAVKHFRKIIASNGTIQQQ